MPSYIFVKSKSTRRGYNLCIRVYKIVRGVPKYLGERDVNTASYKGDKPVASLIIAEKEGYKTDGYHILRQDVVVNEVY